jgi:predicted rRNA methylase YqxC with S4 and FtsJ domains
VRTDERVVVMERTNAVHAEVPAEVVERGGVDLVVIDLGWTAQAKAIPAALRWVGSGPTNESGSAIERRA